MMSYDAARSMNSSSAPSPNEWGCKAQSASDELWEVEWGFPLGFPDTVAKAPTTQDWQSSSWGHSKWQNQAEAERLASMQSKAQQMDAPGTYCVPMIFMVSTQNSAIPDYIPSTNQMPSSAALSIKAQLPVESAPARTPLRPVAAAYTPKSLIAEEISATKAVSENFSTTDISSYDGELPSVGSAGHADGSCKRCAFFPKGRCKNGADCTHCHFPHLPRARLRKRGSGKRDERLQSDSVLADSELENDEEEVNDILKNTDVVDMEYVRESDVAEPIKMFDEADCVKSQDDVTEVETTEPSASGCSDCEEGAFDSEKMFVTESMSCSTSPSQKNLSSDSSDSEIGTPESEETVRTHKQDRFSSSPASWAEHQRKRRASIAHSMGAHAKLPPSEIARMARSLLNKLTEERFESLTRQILDLPFSTPEQLDVVAAEVFEKATTQSCFRSLYVELCIRLDEHLSKKESEIGGKAFRRALVTECQATFERRHQSSRAENFACMTSEERLEAEIKVKTARIGNVQFIGELLVRRLLAPKLMLPIIHELLTGDDAALEDLVALLAVVAPGFEQKASIVQAPLKDAFSSLKQKTTQKGVSKRLCCQITDLLEARARGWTPRSANVA